MPKWNLLENVVFSLKLGNADKWDYMCAACIVFWNDDSTFIVLNGYYDQVGWYDDESLQAKKRFNNTLFIDKGLEGYWDS